MAKLYRNFAFIELPISKFSILLSFLKITSFVEFSQNYQFCNVVFYFWVTLTYMTLTTLLTQLQAMAIVTGGTDTVADDPQAVNKSTMVTTPVETGNVGNIALFATFYQWLVLLIFFILDAGISWSTRKGNGKKYKGDRPRVAVTFTKQPWFGLVLGMWTAASKPKANIPRAIIIDANTENTGKFNNFHLKLVFKSLKWYITELVSKINFYPPKLQYM